MSQSRFGLRVGGLILGILLAAVAGGAAVGYATRSWSLLSSGSGEVNPLHVAFVSGFALAAGLAVYSFLGWRQDHELRAAQAEGFQELKELITMERTAFNDLARSWQQKERAWQEDRQRLDSELQEWAQHYGVVQSRIQQLEADLNEERRKTQASSAAQAQALEDALAQGAAQSRRDIARLEEALEQRAAQHREEIAQLEEQLQAEGRERLTFLTNVSGALKGPVGRIAQIARGGAGSPEAALEEAGRLAERFLRQLDDVLDIAKIQSGAYRLVVSDVAMEKVLSRAVARFRPCAETRQITLVWGQAGHDLGQVAADERLVERSVCALLENALQFTPRAGRVELNGRIVEEDGVRRAVIEVKDNGIGIAPRDHERIFEPFAHARQARGEIAEDGPGLGLALVKEFVRLHGGDVSLTSAAGEGARFTLAFADRESQKARESKERGATAHA